MLKNMSLILVYLFLLFLTFPCLDWQGYGNMSASNITDIWTYIKSNIDSPVSAYNANKTVEPLNQFIENYSLYLNNLWDPAWNIIFAIVQVQSDTILYGYAFRDHWMWYNNYKCGSTMLNIVIWKDYNCQIWMHVYQAANLSSSSQSTVNSLVAKNPNASSNDIWMTAKGFLEALVAFNSGNSAFSMVLSQTSSSNIYYFGKVCTKATTGFAFGQLNASASPWGAFLIIQTR